MIVSGAPKSNTWWENGFGQQDRVVGPVRDRWVGSARRRTGTPAGGEAVHKGTSYPGEHQAIIDRGTWDKVHVILAENAVARANGTRAQTPALLRGVIFAPATQ
jgi:hypothetical protein